jgi:hypothetical protein
MKNLLCIATLAALLVAVGVVSIGRAQNNLPATRYEVAIVKWDSPDKLQFIMPRKTELVRLLKTGVKVPEEIGEEEFCLTWAANKMTQDGWEPLNLDSRRILFRRQVIR